MRTPLILSLRAGCCALALVVAGSGLAQTGVPPGTVLASPDPDFVDLDKHNSEIEKWRSGQQAELRRQGRATAEEFRRIDQQAIERARAAEAHRTRALDALAKRTNTTLGQGPGGTQPAQGRGTLGDIDTASLSGRDYHKVLQEARKAGYTITPQQGDAFTIKELDVTVHREPVTRSSSPVGSSARAAEIARGNNPETAMGLGRNDPAISVADNLKKAAHTVNTPPDKIDGTELQKLGKMTGRNADAIAQVTGQPVDPVTRAQADALKQGYSPEAAGIVRDNATPEQRAQDIADFQKRSKQVSVEAVRAADTHANTQMEKLAGEARHANEVLEATKATGDTARTQRAQAAADAANKAVIEYHETRAAAQNAAAVNDADAAKIVNEARGVSNEGKSPSQIREAAVAEGRKQLTSAAAEPTRAPTTTAEPVKGPGTAEAGAGEAAAGKGGVRSTVMKGAGGALGVYAIYHGIKRGAEEAGKEAGEQGDGALKSAAKTVGYSAWYGVGIGGAIETGKKAGEESAKQWEKDVKEGKVDPNSKLSQAWAHIRGVGWGISEFTGLTAIKDATVEGAGYVKDRYTQYKAEKAEANAKAETAAKTPAAGDKTAGDKAAGDKAAGDKTAGDKTAGDKAAGDKAAGDKTAGDKAAGDKAAGDKTAGDKAAGDKTAGDKAAGDKAAGDKTAGDKTAGDKTAGDKAAADKTAADKAAADKAAADKDKGTRDKDKADKDKADKDKAPIGSAIGAAGVKQLQPPKPPQPVAVVPPPPPPPPPAPQTTEVEGGWVKSKDGMTKVVYINDANGNRIGGYYVNYDASGKETGRQHFKESGGADSQSASAPNPALDGTYSGRITGGSSGSLTITVSGGQVSGTIGGVHEGDPITASFSGPLSADGGFSAAAKGTLRTTWSDGKTASFTFAGKVSGKVNGRSGSGSWSGGNQWGASQGTWSARK